MPIFLCAHLDTVPPTAADRAGRRGRRRPERRRDDSRRRRQVGRRGHARGDAPRRRGGPSARGARAPVHAEGGGRPRRRLRLRPHAAPRDDRVRLRPGGAGRRDRARRAVCRRHRGGRSTAGRRMRACIPEEGRSAIAAAARAIADMRLGRIDEETSANVGVITGGTARNIVPEYCSFRAEARSHDEEKLAELVREMTETMGFAATLEECEVETTINRSYRAYRFRPERSRSCALPRPRSSGRADTPTYLAERRRGGRERLQRARSRLRQPRERHDRDPHAGRAHRRRRPRCDGRRHA